MTCRSPSEPSISRCVGLFTDVHTRTSVNDTVGGEHDVVHSATPSRSHVVHTVVPMVRQPNFSVLMSMVTWSYV